MPNYNNNKRKNLLKRLSAKQLKRKLKWAFQSTSYDYNSDGTRMIFPLLNSNQVNEVLQQQVANSNHSMPHEEIHKEAA